MDSVHSHPWKPRCFQQDLQELPYAGMEGVGQRPKVSSQGLGWYMCLASERRRVNGLAPSGLCPMTWAPQSIALWFITCCGSIVAGMLEKTGRRLTLHSVMPLSYRGIKLRRDCNRSSLYPGFAAAINVFLKNCFLRQTQAAMSV